VSRAPWLTGLALLVLGVLVFLAKTLWLDLPIVPERAQHLWGVELEVTARGIGGRGSIRAVLPAPNRGQRVRDEHVASDRLAFTIRQEGDERIGVWHGPFAGTRRVVHRFRVELPERAFPVDPVGEDFVPDAVEEAYGASTAVYPWLAADVTELLETLGLPPVSDRAGRLLTLYAFVVDEVALSEAGASDALLALGTREGNLAGKTRLLVTLLRGAGIPARLALGLEMRSDRPPTRALWAEAWVHGRWRPAFLDRGGIGTLPADHLILGYDRLESVEVVGVEAATHRYRSLRERLSADEITAMMTPQNPLLESLSLYRLPLATQGALRLLLLMPLGALITAVYRNLIGVPTFGTFMPTLLALALRQSSLGFGMAVVAVVLTVGIASRVGLERLHLLLVPRLSLLLCIVVLAVIGLALLGRGLEIGDLAWGVLLPIVILSMLIERFTVSLAEEGRRNTLIKLAWTAVVALSCYPIFVSDFLAHLMFGYPELVLVVMGLLVWIGGYMGYRLSELLRFRELAEGAQR
jgi:hypothetical protein